MNYQLVMYEVVLKLKAFPKELDAIWGFIVGVLCFLIGKPDMALYALASVIGFDMVTRIAAQASKNGGYFNATRTGAIRSRRMAEGFAAKFGAYFVILALAHMLQYIVPMLVATSIQSVVYSVLFVTEGHSCLENLLDGAKDGSHTHRAIKIIIGQWSGLFEKFLPKKEK